MTITNAPLDATAAPVAPAAPAPARYLAPDAFTRRVMNPVVAWLTRRGLSVWGSRVLRVRGRRSGQWREVPVNLTEGSRVDLDGDFLVAPRGTTQWVRNLRAAGSGELRVGRRVRRFAAAEITGSPEQVAVLRAYLQRWKWEVGQFFDGVGPDASDEELAAIGAKHPTFRVTELGA